jgi:hypothetical protein
VWPAAARRRRRAAAARAPRAARARGRALDRSLGVRLRAACAIFAGEMPLYFQPSVSPAAGTMGRPQRHCRRPLLLLVIVVGVAAAAATATTRRPAVMYVSPHGNDSPATAGTTGDPLATIAECVARLQGPGDECRLKSGRYHEPTVLVRDVHGTAQQPVIIAAADGADVVIDGTTAVEGNWVVASSGLWETHVPAAAAPLGGVTQLWLDAEMLTPARWPNALWSEVQAYGLRAPFNYSNWATFNSSAPWAPANYTSGTPLQFVDAGGPSGLGSSGISAQGAIFIGNIAHDDTFVGLVTSHQAGSDRFEVMLESTVDRMGNTKQGNSMYFLEGGSDLLDQRGEWSFSVEDQKLRIRTPNGRSPLQQSVTHKTQVFAFNISNSPYLILANMTFLGTTINAAGNIPHLVLDSLRFRYPSFSRRMLGDLHTPAHTVISAVSTTPDPEPGPTPQPAPPPPLASCIAVERQWCPHLTGAGVTCEKCVMQNQRAFQQAGCYAKHARHAFLTRFCDPDKIGIYETTAYLQGKPSITAQQSSFVIKNCSFFGADGKAFTYLGTNGIFENNLFESNDWTCHDDDVHTGMGCVLLSAVAGTNDLFTRNTLVGNGPSVLYACGAQATMTLNHCIAQSDIDNDGDCLQIRSSSAVSTTMAYNWVERSAKGLRLDSGSNSAFVQEEVNNTIHANVCLMSHGFELKNDYNRYTNNLAVWPPPGIMARKGAAGATASVFRVDAMRFKGENSHSVLEGNVATNWTTPVPGVTSPKRPNVFDGNVGGQMRDPTNLDFRPRAGTHLAQSGAGPYSDSSGGHCGIAGSYWIPGRRGWRASSPVPPTGSTNVAADLDLMFLPSHGAVTTSALHVVYLGASEKAMEQLGPALQPGCNVQTLPHKLQANNTYVWRVDEVGRHSTVRGEIWNFKVS